MSGPKVVRIVTREELLAQSMVIANRLQEALNRWQAAALAAGELKEDELAQTLQRHRQLRATLNADKFVQFNQEANREIGFLAADLERRRDLAAARRADERKAQLRVGQNAGALLRALKDKELTAEPHVMQALELAALGKADAEVAEKALATGFRILAPRDKTPAVSQAQRELAVRLTAVGADVSFAQWKAVQEAQRPAMDDPRVETIARQCELLRLLGENPKAIDAFEQRLDLCLQAPADNRMSMKLDSLLVELTGAIREAKRLEDLVDEATTVLAQLSTLDDEQAIEAQSQLQTAVAERSHSPIQEAMEACRAVIAAVEKAAAARSRRAAVLQGLAKLGYAVHEGMETAWVESGRVVIQKPGLDGYGVELLGGSDAERLQVRTVALEQDRDTSRDTDAEHLWCGDFTRLKADLALAGSSVFVDKALGVGTVPLKVAQVTSTHVSGKSATSNSRAAS